MRAGSVSPVRRRNADLWHSPDFDRSGGPLRNRGFGSGRNPGRQRNYSPPYGRGREAGRFTGRGYDGPGYGAGQSRGVARGNPNVRPRDGDWMCPDPLCNNLNFARREYCNKCKKSRHAPVGSPKRGYPGPPPPSRRIPGSPIDPPPGRFDNGYRSPPRGWARDDPRDSRVAVPHPRYESRVPGPPIRRGRIDFADADYRDRSRLERPVPLELGQRDHGRENYLSERKGYGRRIPSPHPPPALPHRGQWEPDVRERSRSPVRGGPPPKHYRRDLYMERGRDDRHAVRDAY